MEQVALEIEPKSPEPKGLAAIGTSSHALGSSLHKRTNIKELLGTPGVDARGWPRGKHSVRPKVERICAMHLEILISLTIACAVASAWRGAWLVLDASFLPENPVVSSAASLAGGSVLLVLTTWIQPCLYAMARRHPSRVIWLLDGLFSYVGFWCCVLVWRGMWQLWDHALGVGFAPAPRNLQLERGGWLSHGVGTALLVLLDAVRSLNAPPMIYVSDSGPPIFGARTSPSWDGLLRLDRHFHKPKLPADSNEWRTAVGLPAVDEEQLF